MEKFNDEFVKICDGLDRSIKLIDLQKTRFDKVDSEMEISGVGKLSARAQRNLGRWLSIPQGLMKELTPSVLNDTIREQLVRRSLSEFRVGMNPDGSGEIAFLQPSGHPYLNLSKILEPISKKIIGIRGNPVTDNVLRVLTGEGRIEPNGENLIVGQQLNISSIATIKPTSTFMSYRLICQNGLISTRSTSTYKMETKGASSQLITDILKARAAEVAKWSQELEVYVKEADAKEIQVSFDAVMNDIQESRLVPQTVVNECQVMKAKHDAGEANLQKVGIPGFSTVWNYVNFLTFMSHSLTSFSARQRTEEGAYTWGLQKIKSIY